MKPLTARPFGVPDRLAEPLEGGWSLADTRAMRAVGKWLEDDEARLIVLAGSVGTGKSQAAAWGLATFWQESTEAEAGSPKRMRIRPHGLPKWMSAGDFNREWPNNRAPRDWRRASFLVIDDLGVENLTDVARAMVDAVVCERWADDLRTVITTNAPLQDTDKGGGPVPGFESRYGDRITDRLRESGLHRGKPKYWVTCDGKSLRGHARPVPPGDVEVVEGNDEPPLSFAQMRQIVAKLESDGAIGEGAAEILAASKDKGRSGMRLVREIAASDAEARERNRRLVEKRRAEGDGS